MRGVTNNAAHAATATAHGGEAFAAPHDAHCAACRHRADDRHVLEQKIPGLVVFGSGFGASVASSRLCRVHDQLVSPDDTCGQFSPLTA
ncbi:hypothetical protein SAMN05192543_10882 [Paraburkholderia megapolitana]|uniref:Uncharacterized protein n=1 Tax=Paraburkholderia megapolitana TaxID=420953 RepID=A0A1I3SBT8_9BURK|nr:hypothetical protein SAMN05192543_10882 [Paraburkholderia megapolitana]